MGKWHHAASVDAAKAAAQADYEARILSALDVQPGYTADDLRRAWELGRDAAAQECGDPSWMDARDAIRALTQPADLGDRVKEGRDNG